MTALFGIGMVIIGSRISAEGKPAALLVTLSAQLETELGSAARWAFLLGAWGAIFSSLLGVWQSVPYLFADFLSLSRNKAAAADGLPAAINRRGWAYRGYLYAMATLPIVGLFGNFARVQKAYAVFGAMFIPLLAVALLLLNGPASRVGSEYRNGRLSTFALLAAIGLFLLYGYFRVRKAFGG